MQHELEVVNPFPEPPPRFKLFSKENIQALQLLRERTNTTKHGDLPAGTTQQDILSDQSSIPDISLLDLEPPRLDWVLEGGAYYCYSDYWTIQNGHPFLPSTHLETMFPKLEADQRDNLHTMLRTILRTYYVALGSITEHSLLDVAATPVYSDELDYMIGVALNFQKCVNDIRPLQAQETLEQVLIKQLQDRRQETQAIHNKCDEIEESLASLKALAAKIGSSTKATAIEPTPSDVKETSNDPLSWALSVE
ncbi:Mediator of RNA polymerase II transcription subunit 7 [Tulasnella sp. 418]|nr:Mediator of RNA polymerase II transcription subunit 7 [Tulasnella sp. 418]